ncbi:enoyl-CoA hydratase family protein [Streptomyces smyrnaeus]|uniref:enoyl-CoA hydratase family protein n=1 Tax=Streptomyces smyrnaeus TaxID=1387713 RepID=UPI003688FC5A
MSVSTSTPRDGVAVVTVDHPPVNALPAHAWYDLAETLTAAGRDPAHRAVVLTGTGRGFNAGVDIKELQRTPGHGALIGANRGCAAAFAAVYECEVPVIAAVHGHCLGGGIGLVGNADAVVATEDATFGLPELDRGALGAATHLSRMLPPQLVRPLYYTGRTVTARELHHHGAVWALARSRTALLEVALELADRIAAKDGLLLRLAKEALNGIDPVDVRRSYRYEQGFTFEANLAGVSDRHRDAFLDARPDEGSRP